MLDKYKLLNMSSSENKDIIISIIIMKPLYLNVQQPGLLTAHFPQLLVLRSSNPRL